MKANFTPAVTISLRKTEPSRISIEVSFPFAETDKKRSCGWIIGPKKMALAKRLKRGIEAGVVLVNPKVMSDLGGVTYVSARSTVRGRCLNADLKSMGF